MRTWHAELALVAVVLLVVNLTAGTSPLEWVGALAVLFSFAHAQVADRMAESQASMVRPDVHCWRWSGRYFAGKELLWLLYFTAHHSWSALVGCVVFLLYPLWRQLHRRRGLALLLVLLSSCAHEDLVSFAGAAAGGAIDGLAYAATEAALDNVAAPAPPDGG